MEYYIKGDAANAEQIKTALKAKGISDSGNSFIYDNYLYFTKDGETDFCAANGSFASIIKTHPDYKELELPVKPNFKVGDWIVKKDGNTFYGGNYAEQITLVEVDEKGKYIWLPSKTWVDADYIRLWTIADAKDGDVLALNGKPFIYSSHKYGKNYCYIDEWGQLRVNFSLVFEGNYVCPATKQERDLLFSKMREVGYEWDADKKELHKIKSHYDISNFHEGMPVLVRDGNCHEWRYVTFSHYRKVGTPFCAGGQYWYQCIPFNGDTKHLLGTTDMSPEEYINW